MVRTGQAGLCVASAGWRQGWPGMQVRDWLSAGVGLKDLRLDRPKGTGQPEQVFQPAEGLPEPIRCGRWATRRC